MRKFFPVILLILLLLSLLGCGESPISATQPTTDPSTGTTAPIILDALPNLIRIDGQLYQLGDPLPSAVEVGDERIAGHTLAPGHGVPETNGVTNFAEEGTPYALLNTDAYPNTYVLCYRQQWFVLFPVSD